MKCKGWYLISLIKIGTLSKVQIGFKQITATEKEVIFDFFI